MTERLPIHLAYHLLGLARRTPQGLAVSSVHGPLIEGLAEAVDDLTVVACQPPDSQGTGERATDYLVAGPSNVHLLALGPTGSWRSRRRRAKRVAGIVAEPSRSWDVLAYRFPNRRVSEVRRAQQCPRTIVIDGGAVMHAVRETPAPLVRRVVRMGLAAWVAAAEARVVRSAGLVFVNSRQLEGKWARWTPAVEVLEWSLRRHHFRFQTTERLSGSANIVVAGRITEAKGVFEALDAFAEIRATALPKARLHVVGDGDALGELGRRVSKLGLRETTTFHGWVPTGEPLYRLLRTMDVMLHLSYAESFPRIVWEALAHSVLVVCTPVGGLPDALCDGKEVAFVPVGDAKAAAAATVRLVREAELRRSMLRSGYSRAQGSSVEMAVQAMMGAIVRKWPELRP